MEEKLNEWSFFFINLDVNVLFTVQTMEALTHSITEMVLFKNIHFQKYLCKYVPLSFLISIYKKHELP